MVDKPPMTDKLPPELRDEMAAAALEEVRRKAAEEHGLQLTMAACMDALLSGVGMGLAAVSGPVERLRVNYGLCCASLWARAMAASKAAQEITREDREAAPPPPPRLPEMPAPPIGPVFGAFDNALVDAGQWWVVEDPETEQRDMAYCEQLHAGLRWIVTSSLAPLPLDRLKALRRVPLD